MDNNGDSYKIEPTVFNSKVNININSDAYSNTDSGINYNINSTVKLKNACKASAYIWLYKD